MPAKDAGAQQDAEWPAEQAREHQAADHRARAPGRQEQSEAAVAGVQRRLDEGDLDRPPRLDEQQR